MPDLGLGQGIVGEHPVMKEVFRLARRVATSDLAVNIFGETGTGKELLAHFIHAESNRGKGPFVVVDCGILTIETARSELFGHVRGAFTGAHQARCGLVAEAAAGTLFLDEVGDLDLDLQLQLLRLIQNGTFRSMGESRVKKADVRLITATHRDLKALVKEKKFRADLYHRLQVVPLELPPLRARVSDIPLLVKHYSLLYQHLGCTKKFTQAALDALMRYDWPGNIRELQHEITRLMLMVETDLVDDVDLEHRILSSSCGFDVYDSPFKDAWKQNLQQFTREYLHRKLLKCRGNVTRAAKESGVGRQYFQMRMAECGLRSKTYKHGVRVAD
ncbi:MAG: sigma-54-dependent Fis family transcriptional regulator [Candidatus Latescibacteria bacterium]|nr:sigma-54-dependent Fis family transcriptional regulator [Candidatus Latescibacterota bacterium]